MPQALANKTSPAVSQGLEATSRPDDADEIGRHTKGEKTMSDANQGAKPDDVIPGDPGKGNYDVIPGDPGKGNYDVIPGDPGKGPYNVPAGGASKSK